MENLLKASCEVDSLSPLALAFIGDTVYDLMVRQRLVCQGNRPVKKLHSEAVEFVRAHARLEGIKNIMDMLTEEEQAVFRRGRNARTNHIPKNARVDDYHYATGLESLFGYLYLKGRTERLQTIFTLINGE